MTKGIRWSPDRDNNINIGFIERQKTFSKTFNINIEAYKMYSHGLKLNDWIEYWLFRDETVNWIYLINKRLDSFLSKRILLAKIAVSLELLN